MFLGLLRFQAVILGLRLLVTLTISTSSSTEMGIKRMGEMIKKAYLFLNHLGLEKKHVTSPHVLLAIASQMAPRRAGRCSLQSGSHFLCQAQCCSTGLSEMKNMSLVWRGSYLCQTPYTTPPWFCSLCGFPFQNL